jgi:hypothetical protein
MRHLEFDMLAAKHDKVSEKRGRQPEEQNIGVNELHSMQEPRSFSSIVTIMFVKRKIE